jgi:hypothetical protein
MLCCFSTNSLLLVLVVIVVVITPADAFVVVTVFHVCVCVCVSFANVYEVIDCGIACATVNICEMSLPIIKHCGKAGGVPPQGLAR